MRKVEISHKTIIFAFLFAIFLWFLFVIKDIILQFFVALLLTAILEPLVVILSTKAKLPRALSVFVSYILVIGVFVGIFALIIPPLVDESSAFVKVLPGYINNLGLSQYFNTDLSADFLSKLGNVPTQILKFSVSVLSNFASVLTVLVFTFYLLLARNGLEHQLGFLFGDEKRNTFGKLITELETKLGGWARGQLALMFLVGFLTFIALSLLRIPYAVPIALLAGILEIIPYIGPVLAAIPAILIGFSISPAVGIGAVVVSILVQQLENYVFVPKIMQKSVGISPIAILLALSIGAKLAGVVGMIISIPLIITIQTFSKHYFAKN